MQGLGDVVFAVEVVVAEDAREDILGQDVLDQHLTHVVGGDGRVDARLSLPQEIGGGGAKAFVARVGLIDPCAERDKNGGQVGLELDDGLAKFRDLRPLPAEEQVEQSLERRAVFGLATGDLDSVLNQDGLCRILEDDVGAGVAAPEFLGDRDCQEFRVWPGG